MMRANQRSVTVDRLKLIDKLKENLTIHKQDFEEAVVGYRLKIIADLEFKLSQVKNASDVEALKLKPVGFAPPQSYEAQYIDAIEMLEWSESPTIELDEALFKAYIQNQWVWSSSVDVLNSSYKMFAAGLSLE